MKGQTWSEQVLLTMSDLFFTLMKAVILLPKHQYFENFLCRNSEIYSIVHLPSDCDELS